jgi:carbonic anhydrase
VVLRPRLDLGLRQLAREWRALLRPQDLGRDLAAGSTVACIALPLSLAIALASGVTPAVGLVTAIVGGIVCALFGGTPLQTSGPAAAMAVLVATIVQEHGLAALLLVTVGCGVLQLLVGVLGLGRFVRLVPLPVIEGFTAGIGAIIVIGQLPRALGLPPPAQSHVTDVITHIADLIHRTSAVAVVVTLVTLGVIYGLPRITRRLPAHLVAVVIATALVVIVGWETPRIGEIPRSLPAPHLPALPAGAQLGALAASTVVVFALASLETLLSSTVVDKMTGTRSEPDQELIGQGLGNVASALFGGIPVTGVIVRSSTNVQAGAKTRRSTIIHSLALVATVLVLAPWMEKIPVAALAGVLFSVAFRMLDPASFRRLWRHSRGEGAVYAVTFSTIVFVDLLEGVQWGIVAALAIAAVRLGGARMATRAKRLGDHYLFKLEGPLTFLSSLEIDAVRTELNQLEEGRSVVFDLDGVETIDASGAELVGGLLEQARARTSSRSCSVRREALGRSSSTCSERKRRTRSSPTKRSSPPASASRRATRRRGCVWGSSATARHADLVTRAASNGSRRDNLRTRCSSRARTAGSTRT